MLAPSFYLFYFPPFLPPFPPFSDQREREKKPVKELGKKNAEIHKKIDRSGYFLIEGMINRTLK